MYHLSSSEHGFGVILIAVAAAVPPFHAFLQAGCSQEANASLGSSPDSSSCCTPTAAQLFVIDPSFRDAFLLSNATPAYQRLWEQLPSLFVGTADQLVTVVEFMCMQVRIVFKLRRLWLQ
jgi:hypothetical protein